MKLLNFLVFPTLLTKDQKEVSLIERTLDYNGEHLKLLLKQDKYDTQARMCMYTFPQSRIFKYL